MPKMDKMKQIQVDWEYYYWSEDEVNDKGESLQTCMSKYGVGGWYSTPSSMAAALVFKTEERLASKSWLLGVKLLPDNLQIGATMYEAMEHCFRVPASSAFGSEITEQLHLKGLWKDAEVDPN